MTQTIIQILDEVEEALRYYEREYDASPCDNLMAKQALAKIPALREAIMAQGANEYTAFQHALKEWGSPDDEFGQYHCDSGNLYALWGRAVEWATKQPPEQSTRLRAIVEGVHSKAKMFVEQLYDDGVPRKAVCAWLKEIYEITKPTTSDKGEK